MNRMCLVAHGGGVRAGLRACAGRYLDYRGNAFYAPSAFGGQHCIDVALVTSLQARAFKPYRNVSDVAQTGLHFLAQTLFVIAVAEALVLRKSIATHRGSQHQRKDRQPRTGFARSWLACRSFGSLTPGIDQ